jgi:hypothetical protein
MMVEDSSSFFNHSVSSKEKETRKSRLHTNATLDKNNSQRIRFFRVK